MPQGRRAIDFSKHAVRTVGFNLACYGHGDLRGASGRLDQRRFIGVMIFERQFLRAAINGDAPVQNDLMRRRNRR